MRWILFVGLAALGVACGDDASPVDAGSDAARDAAVADGGEDAGSDSGPDASCPDVDGDGYANAACGGDDCNDSDADVHPGVTDLCGNGDEDCDEAIDEDPELTFYRDMDGDGYGLATDTIAACSAPEGYVDDDTDCDDEENGVNPGVGEECEGSVDENCDGNVDEDCTCTAGATDAMCGVATDVGACAYGTRTCEGDGTWGPCTGAVIPRAEVCDGGTSDEDDENCDGTIDEGCDCTNGEARGCRHPAAMVVGSPAQCTEVTQRCADGAWPRDCSAETVVGPSRETCDGSVDQDCDGSVDEGCGCTAGTVDAMCGPTTDVGACEFGTRTCQFDGTWGACMGAVFPATEVCDGGTSDENDENCDGTIDDGCTCTNGSMRTCRDPGAVVAGPPSQCTEVTQRCIDGEWPRDCSAEGLIGPSTETCDGTVDQDCDGNVDEGCMCTNGRTQLCGTNIGECTRGFETCEMGAWVGCTGTPPVTEICDHLDNDCNSVRDNGVNVTCSWSASSSLPSTFDCLPGPCRAVGADIVQLGWNVFFPWAPGSGSEVANVAYLTTPVDWGALGMTVRAQAAMSKWDTSIGLGIFGVMLSPRAELGSDANHGMPMLGSGEMGFAAAFDSLTQLVFIYELRDGADPILRATASTPFGCFLTTAGRDITVELDYALGTLTAQVTSPGCSSATATHTLTSGEIDDLYGVTSSYPTYYPGVFGHDGSGGVAILLQEIDVEPSWNCDGCPW